MTLTMNTKEKKRGIIDLPSYSDIAWRQQGGWRHPVFLFITVKLINAFHQNISPFPLCGSLSVVAGVFIWER